MDIRHLKHALVQEVFKNNPTPTFQEGIIGAAKRAEFMGQRLVTVNRIANDLIAKHNPTDEEIENDLRSLIIGLTTQPFSG